MENELLPEVRPEKKYINFDFTITLDNGSQVKVSYDNDITHHLEFYSELISETGYRSHFFGDYNKETMEKNQIINHAKQAGQHFHNELMKKQPNKQMF